MRAGAAGFALAAGVTLFALALGESVTRRGAEAIGECDQALSAGDRATAIERARDAAMSLFPGSPYPAQGYARLTTLAEAAETRDDFGEAIFAWRAIRTSIVATRSETREAAKLADANRAMVRLAARACEGSAVRTPAACAKLTAAALGQDDLPPTSSFALLAVGAMLFLCAGGRAAWVSEPRRAAVWGALALTGAVVSAVALVR